MIEPLLIEATALSPKIVFDGHKGIFEISGNSYMNNPVQHYEILFTWLKKYVDNPLPTTTFIFNANYINSVSRKLMNEIIKLLSQIQKKGETLIIEWHYSNDDEDDMLQFGQQLEQLNSVKFIYVNY